MSWRRAKNSAVARQSEGNNDTNDLERDYPKYSSIDPLSQASHSIFANYFAIFIRNQIQK
jgi:hypothetical protein